MRCSVLALAVVALSFASCSKVASLEGTPPMALSPAEQEAVRAKVEAARAAGDWTAAWNQEVDAGGDRALLEAIAVEALAADDGAAEDMLAELMRRHGGLSAEGRARVAAAVQRHEAKGDWKGAVDLELAAAEDPPEYQAAWAVYRRAPLDEAPGVLGRIRERREKHGASAPGAPGAGR